MPILEISNQNDVINIDDLESISIYQGDCLELLKKLPANSIGAVITDPPYGMSQHSQQDIINALTAWLAGNEYTHGKAGFMGKEWDSFVPSPTVWKEVLRVLKPGGHILCAASTRTVDLMGISLRLAGFEIRDEIIYAYGSGFPKSLDISKQIDKMAGAEREKYIFTGIDGRNRGLEKSKGKAINPSSYDLGERSPFKDRPSTEAAKQWNGFGTALKPAHEPFILARKPIENGLTIAENCLKWGAGSLDIDSCRVQTDELTPRNNKIGQNGFKNSSGGLVIPNDLGRFPANLILSDDECVRALFPDTKSGGGDKRGLNNGSIWGNKDNRLEATNHEANSGSAARFFYCAKPSPGERNYGLDSFENKTLARSNQAQAELKRGNNPKDACVPGNNNGNWDSTVAKNHHPTVKPLSLTEYLIKLISKEGDIILDPFVGSGTTLVAAKKLGRRAIGCELDAEYCKIAQARVDAVTCVYDEQLEKMLVYAENKLDESNLSLFD